MRIPIQQTVLKRQYMHQDTTNYFLHTFNKYLS